jgi:hypothetical protein
MNILLLHQMNDSALKALFTGQQMTALMGSGASIWKPTNLPSGISVGQSLYRVLLDQIPELANHSAGLEPLFKQLPFENIMEACPENAVLRGLLKHLYNTNRYNSIHELLAQAIAAKTIGAIITTNYDCCLENPLWTKKNGSKQAVFFVPLRQPHFNLPITDTIKC